MQIREAVVWGFDLGIRFPSLLSNTFSFAALNAKWLIWLSRAWGVGLLGSVGANCRRCIGMWCINGVSSSQLLSSFSEIYVRQFWSGSAELDVVFVKWRRGVDWYIVFDARFTGMWGLQERSAELDIGIFTRVRVLDCANYMRMRCNNWVPLHQSSVTLSFFFFFLLACEYFRVDQSQQMSMQEFGLASRVCAMG